MSKKIINYFSSILKWVYCKVKAKARGTRQTISCAQNPCKNSATCVNDNNGAFLGCFCRTGFNGKFCEYPRKA